MRKKGVIIYLSEFTINKLDVLAEARGQSRSELIRDAIKEFLNKPENRRILEGTVDAPKDSD